jgi:hypothetical protein
MNFMFKRLDRSSALAKIIASVSEFMAKRRGLPVVIGIVVLILSFIIQLVDAFAPSKFLNVLGIIMQNSGILIALVGLLLAEALGK